MAWRDLNADLAALFESLSGHGRVDEAIAAADVIRRRAAVERNADWRRRNPEHARKLRREQRRRWRQRYPDKHRAQKRAAYAAKRARTRKKGTIRDVRPAFVRGPEASP